jgi:ATP-dependent helicase/nuclease subunit B
MADGPAAPRLFEVPAHLPFLDAIAHGVLGMVPGAAPERLSTTTILLPTRRAARALRTAFLRAAAPQARGSATPPARGGDGGRALLLPRLRALAGLSVEDADELALPGLLDLPPAVDPLTRQAALTAMIQRLPPRHGGPRTVEQAWSLAGALAQLLDEMALEERDPTLRATAEPEAVTAAWLDRLATLVPERHATHWQITLQFLRGVLAQWQGWLAERDLLDIGLRRVRALQMQAEAWAAAPPPDPVIAAGIGVGGTIPAAAALLRVIAGVLPQGAVVLHGLDRAAPDAVWGAIGDAPTHPANGQHRLLAALGVGREAVARWPGCDAAAAPAAIPTDRAALLAMALQPAEGLPAWQARRPHRWQPALAGLSLLTAPDAQAEAVAIALTLREALETPGARAALVTPDRDLARRVSAELIRHGIACDDSAGEPLGETPPGAFLRLIACMVAEAFAPVPLLAVLKHPLCAAGMARPDWMAAVRRLEVAALRGPRPGPGLAGLHRAVAAAFAGARQDAAAQAAIAALLEALAAALGPFAALPDSPARPPADLLRDHLAAAEALAATPERPGALRLYAGEAGEVLARHLAALAPAMAALGPIAPAAWPTLFDAALDGVAAPSLRGSSGGAAHPRVAILGLLEARLLTFDRVVLGALDEGVWPLATDPGPWMSRPMRAGFGLPEPEARIGRVCADFLLAAGAAPAVVLSRAARRGGAPTVPARWLTRLETFLKGQTGAEHPDGLRVPESPAAGWAARLDQPAAAQPCARPAPAPPAAARPRSLTASDIALLIADPYAFYAKRVLRLAPLEPLDADVGAADYGTLVHAVLRRFLDGLGPVWPGEAAALAAWEVATEAAFDAAQPPPAVAAFWGPRLARIGGFVVAQEAGLRQAGGIRRSLAEAPGRLALRRPGGTVSIEARADRLDEMANGLWRVLDYKTGAAPGDADLADGKAPQLPVEAMLLEAGAYQGIAAGSVVGALVYWRLTGGDPPGEVKELPPTAKDGDGTRFAELAAARLRDLVDDWLLGTRPFASRPHPARKPPGGEYNHLARVAEWSGEA